MEHAEANKGSREAEICSVRVRRLATLKPTRSHFADVVAPCYKHRQVGVSEPDVPVRRPDLRRMEHAEANKGSREAEICSVRRRLNNV